MSIFSNPASSTPAEVAEYVAGLLHLLGDHDPVMVLLQTPAALQRFLDTVPAHIVVSPEAPDKWSIREVVQHLADSELVGGFRLRMVLAHDRPPLTGYDQDLWASRLRYRDVEVTNRAIHRAASGQRAYLGALEPHGSGQSGDPR